MSKKKQQILKTKEQTASEQAERAKLEADVSLLPHVSNATIIAKLQGKSAPDDFMAIIETLQNKALAMLRNPLEIEALLANQAIALQSLFEYATQKMAGSQWIEHAQTWGGLALKAQKQCRNTLNTLAEIKQPKKTTFIKQQNNAMNQQVNNRVEQTQTENFAISANELLSEKVE